MPQNCETGREAALFGPENYQRVMACLGAEAVLGPSDNAIWNGRKVNIKSARLGNTKIGATLKNLAWADSVIAAIQEHEAGFTLYEVTSDWFKTEMRPSRQPHTMMVDCTKISMYGTKIGYVPA